MASSLAANCTALKQGYDACFNHWFADYLMLVSPPLPLDSSTQQVIPREREKREKAISAKKADYDKKCGDLYKQYMGCLHKSIGEKEGLSEMLELARAEEPLAGWGGIKVVTEDDLKG